jgi:cation diffusion facilitator CzcD-associated flavoprotein CzcO
VGARLQNTAPQYHLPAVPWSAGAADRHPTAEQIVRHWQAIIDERNLEVKLGFEVAALDWCPAPSAAIAHAGEWRAMVADVASGCVQARTFSHVIVAGGLFVDKAPPPRVPGADRFCGRLLHEREITRSSDLRGERIVVVGNGASAIGLATIAADCGA